MFRVAFSNKRLYTEPSQNERHIGTVIGSVSVYGGRPLFRPSRFSSDWWYVCYQRNAFHDIMPIRTCEAHSQRNSIRVDDNMVFRTWSRAICGIWPCFWASPHRANRTTVHSRSAPVKLVRAPQFRQQQSMQVVPNPRQIPVPQAPPARHPRATELRRQHFPRNAGLKDKQNSLAPVDHPLEDARR